MALVKLALVLAPRLHLGDDSNASGSSVGLLDYVGYIVCNRTNNKCNDGCVCCVYCVLHCLHNNIVRKVVKLLVLTLTEAVSLC